MSSDDRDKRWWGPKVKPETQLNGLREWLEGSPLSRVPQHFVRLVLVFSILLFGMSAIWAFVIPTSLKDMEWHRAATMEREAARPIKYAGAAICRECHEEEAEIRVAGFHRDLSCETCHGPLYGHSEDPLENGAGAPQARGFCPVCHAYDSSRPTGFPQIDPIRHNPVTPCIECHDPHDPVPPETPHECSACHGQIFDTKSFSPHALLDCITCHETPEAHRENPRAVRPQKPTDRAFCGQCHGIDSEYERTAKVDLETHEERYLCWQCHYPHMPEAR